MYVVIPDSYEYRIFMWISIF